MQPAPFNESFADSTTAKHPQKAWLIQGVNQDGKRFRPSDWAERLGTLHASFIAGRLIYSPMLYPEIRNGVKCLHIDSQLQQESPAIYDQIMAFARINGLNIIDSL